MDSRFMSSVPPARPSLFTTPQLPNPTLLNSYARNATLPPQSPSSSRYASAPYPSTSLSNTASQLPTPPMPSSSQMPWPQRRMSSHQDRSPPMRHSDSPPHEPESAPRDEHPVKHEGEDSMSTTSDFVRKLYKMLEDVSYASVVSWGPHGDCFVVKDMNEFTKTILPRMFKHSNFASFVRQLNKYDFHKVKNTDDNPYGEHSWTFRHPDFHADRRDALENIKRKVPAQRKSNRGGNSPTPSADAAVEALQNRVERMQQAQDEMAAYIRNLETNYENVLAEMVTFQRNMAQQDGLMQNLIQYFLQQENGKLKAEELASAANDGTAAQQQTEYAPDPNPFLPATEAQRMIGGTYPDSADLAMASFSQMNEISRRAELAGMTFSNLSTNTNTSGGGGNGSNSMADSTPSRSQSSASRLFAAAAGFMPLGSESQDGSVPTRPFSRQDALARIQELSRSRPTLSVPTSQAQIPSTSTTSSNVDTSAYGSDPYVGFEPSPPVDVPSLSSSSSPSSVALSGPSSPSNFAARYGIPINHEAFNHEGLQVFTVGHLLPRSSMEDENGNWSFDPNSLNNTVVMPTPQQQGPDQIQTQSPFTIADPTPSAPGSSSNSTGPTRPGSTLRVRRTAYVPGWTVPPRVLLVDDDAVSRKLGSKFLQVFGCTIDVAVDGVGAVNKMNLEKYDLVLMDIVMPKLDGVSATSMIRQFDHMTPIISMTSNSKPTEIMKYYSSGMNDILPKPFTKDGLFDMLEKHLMHLKVMETMARVPRGVGIPPLNDASFNQALSTSASNMVASSSTSTSISSPSMFPPTWSENDGRINPLAGMGLSDEQYAMILQNLVSSGDVFMGVGSSSPNPLEAGAATNIMSNKRPMDETEDDRNHKRSRFELIE